jgi:hypothetical protein
MVEHKSIQCKHAKNKRSYVHNNEQVLQTLIFFSNSLYKNLFDQDNLKSQQQVSIYFKTSKKQENISISN